MSKFSTHVQKLLAQMTLEEKIGQLQQTTYVSDITTGHTLDTSNVVTDIKAGRLGSILSVYDTNVLKELQRFAIEESRLKIPLLFCFDVIHGYRTAFPINLALSSSFDPNLIKRVSKAVAYETSHAGLHLTFSPMVDIVRDPRWGRVMESNGEDPYLSARLTEAYVKGYQGLSLRDENSVAACVKHFAGYGFAEAGREYNTVDLSERTLRNIILPPFKAAIDTGVSMVMTGFNVLFERPATANKWLLQDILREALSFDGVVISDYSSTEEIINHKVAEDLKDVAHQCFDAGIDMEMGSVSYASHLKELIESGTIKQSKLDSAVGRILALKEALGLFDKPYRNFVDNPEDYMLQKETIDIALEATLKSMVLLKNEGVLPLKENHTIAVVGRFGQSQDVIGEWPGLTRKEEVITIQQAFNTHGIAADYYETLDALKGVDLSLYDRVILTVGEAGNEAGEGHSKADINLSAADLNLLTYVQQQHASIVSIVYAGRPLILLPLHEKTQAILYAYQPGTMNGEALYQLLFGIKSPSGKLTMTFPSHQGQIPLYYNHFKTGRPLNPNDPHYRYRSHYIDQPNDPLYPFGHGLTYGHVVVESLNLNHIELQGNERLSVKLSLYNDSDVTVEDVIQLYIEAQSYSVSRPVNELKRFQRIAFKACERKEITFTLSVEDFRSYNQNMEYRAEKRLYTIKAGLSSQTMLHQTINVID